MMTPSGYAVVTTWGLWALGLAILLIAALMWCHDVNRKLKYIMSRLHKTGKGSEDMDLVALGGASASGKVISPLAAFLIIAGAIVLLFVLPLWLLNR